MGRSLNWTTKAGKTIPIKSMGTLHLINAIKMIEQERATIPALLVYKQLKEELAKRRMKNDPNKLLKELL